MKGIRSQDEFQENPGKGNNTVLFGVKIKLNNWIALVLVFSCFLLGLPGPDALRSVLLPVSIGGYLHSLGSSLVSVCSWRCPWKFRKGLERQPPRPFAFL